MKKVISKITMAGLLIGALSAVIPVKARDERPIHTRLTERAKETRKLATVRQNIHQDVAQLKKTIKKIQRARAALPGIIAAAGLPLIVSLGLAAGPILGPAILSPSIQVTQVIGGGLAIRTIANESVPLAIVFLEPSIWLSKIIASFTIKTIFDVSKDSLSKALKADKRLGKLILEYPNILTQDQKAVIAKFKKLARKPLIRGIIKAQKLKIALNKAVGLAVAEGRNLVNRIATIKGAGSVGSVIKKYIKLNWQQKNLSGILSLRKKQMEFLKTARDKQKRFTSAYRRINRKLRKLRLNPKFLIIKMRKNSVDRKIKRLERKYSGFTGIQNAIQQFKESAKNLIKS